MTRKKTNHIFVMSLLLGMALPGCTAAGGSAKCEVGELVSCVCSDGALGQAECQADQKKGDCVCADAGDALSDADPPQDASVDVGVDGEAVDVPNDDTPPALDTSVEDLGEGDVSVEDMAVADLGIDGSVTDTNLADTSSEDASSEDTATEDVTLPEDIIAPPPVDCANLPEGPFELVKLQGPMASEDLDFDMEGNVVGSNDKAIFRSGYNESPKVFVPDMKFRAGMRFLPNGHLVVCDNQKGQIVRIDTEGNKFPLMVGLSYPNGITVDMEGWVYFTEHDGNKVWRVHPFTGESTLLTNKISNPNGLTFSPDYSTLYIGGFNGGKTIWAMSISANGTPGKLVPWSNVGTGWHDGMATDICGNVYIADYNQTAIYRISPDGQTKTLIIDGTTVSGAYLPNMKWGSGIGGWSKTKLYLPDGWNKGVFEVDVGVPGAPTPYP